MFQRNFEFSQTFTSFYNAWEHMKKCFYFFNKITRIENYNVEIAFFTKRIFSILFTMAYAMA